MSWKIGNIKITKIVEVQGTGAIKMVLPQATDEEVRKLTWMVPDFAQPDGMLKSSIHSLVLETGNRRIVVDTGLGNDKQGRPIDDWNGLQTSFLDDMTKAGFPPESIDTVVCTHLHVDHVGWNTRLVDGKWAPTFSKARYVFGKHEFDYWKSSRQRPMDVAVFDDSIAPIAEAGLVDLIPSDYKLTDEITMIPSPGHSPGHMSIHIKSAGEECLLLGDVAHSPVQMHYVGWSSHVDFDGEQSARTRWDLFSRFADRPVLVIGGHFDGGYIKRSEDAFRYELA
ncbi:MBL fold metallo-hydrolase [Bradyrhizobium vignae]|uniref:MBL fold metallo-hydrolase n=1 Tax=Bradyrhizobium vignae TaxID=1549949 RepID=UPI00100C001C|nr:MBL fold metallo-hydrolase [Bradyrhizobium vignae]RXH06674.1 MBL fold metallo-hydrolase [Bradyrhizobium vignae]